MALGGLIAFATGCSSSNEPGAWSPVSGETPSAGYHDAMQLAIGGDSRSYDLYVPEFSDDRSRPLVLLFHGQGGSAAQLMGQAGRGAAPFKEWMTLANSDNIVLAIPNGLEGSGGRSGWNDCRGDATTNPAADDVAFVEALVDELSDSLSIDRDRVFATGISNGGHMSLRLAVERPELVAGVAPIAAAMPAASLCPRPTIAVPVLFINGTEDPFLPFDGGAMPRGRGTVLSALESVQLWAALSAEDPVLPVTDLPDLASDDGSTVVAHRSSIGVDAWLYEVVGGGHTEPSVSERYSRVFKRIVGEQNADIESASETWAFFNNESD